MDSQPSVSPKSSRIRQWVVRFVVLFVLLCLLLAYPVWRIATFRIAVQEFTQVSKPFLELGGYTSGPEMGQLAGIAGIEVVRLDGTKTKDDDLVRLRSQLESLPSLRIIRLDETQVTDKGIAELVGLHRLESLYLHETQVTPQGVEDLQRQLPQCKIECGP